MARKALGVKPISRVAHTVFANRDVRILQHGCWTSDGSPIARIPPAPSCTSGLQQWSQQAWRQEFPGCDGSSALPRGFGDQQPRGILGCCAHAREGQPAPYRGCHLRQCEQQRAERLFATMTAAA